MHKEIENEHIDVTQWLPQGVKEYVDARKAQGGHRIDKYGQPRFVPMNVMTVLHDHDVLTDDQIEAARKFTVWRAMLAHALGADRLRVSMSAETGRDCQEDNYVMLVKLMDATDLRIVTEACDRTGAALAQRLAALHGNSETAYKAAKRSLRNLYYDAFEELEKNVKEIK